jgi:ribosomal protein S18 acetylase RimI-like enzyme
MTNERYNFEPLDVRHDRAAFSCGVDVLDRYLRQQAGQEMRRRVAAVFVLHDREQGAIVGYYTLSATAILATELPSDVTKKLPRYPSLPAVLLGRLAVDIHYHGQGFGELLLLDALHRALAQDQVAAMAVVVDAKDDVARRFYERYGFRKFLNNEYRLFIPMATTMTL